MNAFTPTNPEGDEPRRGIVSVPPAERQASYQRIVAQHEAETRAERRRTRGRYILTGGLLATTLGLATAVVVMLPLKQIVPVFVHINSDGTFTSTINQSDVPASLQAAVIQSTLWLYVSARERYTYGGHANDQQTVFTLSTTAVGNAYDAEMNERNPSSYWRRYGERGRVTVERISEGLGCSGGPCDGRDPDVYLIRFRKTVRVDAMAPQSTQVQATVRFRQVPRIPAYQRVTGNPMGLQVVGYDTTEEGMQR